MTDPGLDAGTVQRVALAIRAPLIACYGQRVASGAEQPAVRRVRFVIGQNGTAGPIGSWAEMLVEPFEYCAVEAIRGLRFPRPAVAVTVEIPIELYLE
jgi:hypothetical protein